MNFKPKRALRALTLAGLAISAASCATAQSGWGSGSEDGFRYYFSVTTEPSEWRQGRNWSNTIEFDTDIMSRDYVILYQHLTGLYPKPGPHLAQAPGYMDAHLTKLKDDVEFFIPDPAFSGIVILDFEVFRAVWDRTRDEPSTQGPAALDLDFKSDWRDYIEAAEPGFADMNETEQEEYLRDTYEAAVRDFFLATLNRVRELRPNARYGFYGYPVRFYKNRKEAPTNVISYDDGTHLASRRNDRLQWMWDAVDIISPSIYPGRVVAAPGEELCELQYDAAEDWLFIKNMLGEARRVANGKPVMPFITAQYGNPNDCLRGQDLVEGNLYNQIFGPARLGAEGVILWGNIDNGDGAAHWQHLLDERIMPKMTEAVAERRAAEDDGPSANAKDEGDNGNDDSKAGRNGKTRALGAAEGLPTGNAGAKRVSTRRSLRAPSIRYNPLTDRVSLPTATPEQLRAAKNRADLARPKKRDE
jgi:hypothetical protein